MTSQPSAHSVVITALAELIGISILAIFADTSDAIGKAAVAIMAGWLLIFLITNASWLQGLAGKL
jgi:hypothetical protein